MGRVNRRPIADSQQSVRNDQGDFSSRPHRNLSANWQIPRGVAPGTWDYVRGTQIAEGYDRFLENDPLAAADQEILDRYLPMRDSIKNQTDRCAPMVADFGCGAGRHAIALAQSGYRVLAFDLSLPMLNCMQEKISRDPRLASKISTFQINLVELEGVRSKTVDHAICLFSTLGMIQRQENRIRFLKHVRRIMKPSGRFILHAHSLWYQLRYPGGARWLTANWFRSLTGSVEFGDRFASYRGVNHMFIHSFRRNELRRDLITAGFESFQWHAIGAQSSTAQTLNWRNRCQAVGWIVIAS